MTRSKGSDGLVEVDPYTGAVVVSPDRSRGSAGRAEAGSSSSDAEKRANLDKLLIVASCNEDYNESRIERFLTLATSNGIEPVLVLTKADLTDQGGWYETRTQALTSCKIYLINATNDGACEKLLENLIFGETTALIGSSGVGKSTIVNSLFKQDISARDN